MSRRAYGQQPAANRIKVEPMTQRPKAPKKGNAPVAANYRDPILSEQWLMEAEWRANYDKGSPGNMGDFRKIILQLVREVRRLRAWGEVMGGQREASGRVQAAPMTAIPEPPKKANPLTTTLREIQELHKPMVTQVVTGDCAVGECDHEGDCPTVHFEYCAACNEIAETANSTFAEEQGMGFVSHPCTTRQLADKALGETS